MTQDKQTKAIHIVQEKYSSLSSHLNEKSRRIWAAAEARSLGRGGMTTVHKATGFDCKTIKKGLKELDSGGKADADRIRKKGGGRKKLKETNKELVEDLESLIEPYSEGDPVSPLMWTCKSTYNLAEALVEKGYSVVQKTVYNILVDLDYSMRGNKKSKEKGADHPDGNAQFEHINEKVKFFQKEQCPTLSVDTKKKENIGLYKNDGEEWLPKGKETEVSMHDFPDKELGKVVPYGVCDTGKNKGWVSVGISSDTAQFAVNTIRSWWYKMGKLSYGKADKILISADSGGSNGYRVRLWKTELQKLADEIKKEIHVCHFPPGTSKWNKIEHRMFSYITENRRGRPLISRETVVNCIGKTTTEKGLVIKSQLDENIYEKGIKISDKKLAKVNLIKEDFHGEWNYKIIPQ